MKRKSLLFLLLFALLAPWAANAQETLTVCDGTTTNGYIPFYGSYVDTQGCTSEFVISSETEGMDDMAGGTISKLTFYISGSPDSWGSPTIQVYMGEVDGTTLSGISGPSSFTTVYTGTISNQTNPLVIELSDAYTYQGGNLLIGTYVQTESDDYCFTSFLGVSAASGASYYYSGSSWGSPSAQSFLPKTTFEYTPGQQGGDVCDKPATCEVSEVTATSATLTWSGGSGTYNVELKGGSYTDWTPLLQTTTLTTTPLTLQPTTSYQARVQSVCTGDTPTSGWKTSSTFTTPCDTHNIPYTYDFEAEGPFACWTPLNSGTARYNGYGYNSSSYSLRFYGTTSNMIALPQFNEATNNLRVEFWTRPESNSTPSSYSNYSGKFAIGYMTDITDASTFVAVETYNSTEMTTTYVKKTVDLTNAPAGANIAMRQFDCATNYYWFVDNVTVKEIPSCFAPTGLAANATTTSAELSWTANSGETAWTLYWKKTTDETYTEVPNATNPYTLNGLDAATNYQYYVVANCSADEASEASEVFPFVTECEAISTYPWTENFDSYTGASGGSTNNLPLCWNYINTSTYSYYKGYPVIYSASGYSHSGNNHLRFYSYYSSSYSYDPQDQYAILPVMENLNGKQLSLFARGANTNSSFKVGLMTDPTDVSTFVEIATTTPTTGYVEYTYNLTGTGNYIAIMMEAANSTATSRTVYIDDISIAEPPACPKPTDLTVVPNSVTPHSVQLSWVSDATAWIVAYKTADDADFTEVNATENPFTLTGLAENTAYTAKVCAVCDGTPGEWSANTVSFTTPIACPAPTNLAYSGTTGSQTTLNWSGTSDSYDVLYRTSAYADGVYEQFNASSIPSGWTRYSGLVDGVVAGTTNLTSVSGYWNINSYALGEYNMKLNIHGSSINHWLVTPEFELNQNLSFDLALTDYGNAEPIEDATAQADDRFVVLIYADNAWTILREWNNTGSEYVYNTIATTGEHVDINLSAYVGKTVKIAFYGESTAYGGDNDLHIDNVYCGIPHEAGEWQTAAEGVTGTTYTLTGLNPETDYEAKVLSNCEGETGHETVISFTTEAACMVPTELRVVSVTTTTAVLTWTSSSTAWQIQVNEEEPIEVTSIPYTLEGLTPATTYTFKVRANCDGSYTDWSNVASFTTDCDAITTFPWSEDFESYSASSSGVKFEAPCWVNEHISGNGSYFFEVYSGTNGTNSTKQLRLRDMSSGTMTKLMLPEMTLPGNDYLFAIDVYRNNSTANYGEGIRVFVSTDGEIEGATELAFISRSYATSDGNLIPAESTSGWYTYELPIGISGTCYIILRGESLYGSSTYMDNFAVKQMPTCLKPTAFECTATTTTTATFSWTNGAEGQTAWQICLNGDEENLIMANSNPFTVEDLTASTNYTAKVRAYCSEEDQSEWSNEVSFATECEAITTFPWTENFNSLTAGIPVCWDNSDGTTTTESYKWNYYADGHDGAGLRFNSYNNSSNNTNFLKTPTLSLPADKEMQLSFWYKNPAGGDFSVYISTDGGATYTTALATGLTGVSSWTEHPAIDLAAYAGQEVVIVFKGTSNWGYDDAYIYLDDVTVRELDPCSAPHGLAAVPTYNSAALSWEGIAENYKVRYREIAAQIDWDSFRQVGSDVTATGEYVQYTFDLSNYSDQGHIAIRHYNVTDQFYLDVDDITYGGVTYNFDDGKLPEGWMLVDKDGDNFNWEVSNLLFDDEETGEQYSAAYSGEYAISSASYDNPTYTALTPDNWIILPYGDLGGTLTLYAKGRDADFAEEVFGVFVSTEEIGENEWIEVAENINGTTYNLTGLNPLTTYEFQVQVADSECEDPEWSTSQEFTTLNGNIFVTDGNWNEGSNWLMGSVPADGADVIINANAVIPAEYTANVGEVTLSQDGGSITIADGGQLFYGSDNLVVTMEKTISAYTDANGTGNYYLLAFPFRDNLEVPAAMTAAEGNDFYTFDNSAQGEEWQNNRQQASAIEEVTAFEGYLYANPSSIDLSFTGTTFGSPAAGFGYAITYTYDADENEESGWLLLGNPLTCNAYIYGESNSGDFPMDVMYYDADGVMQTVSAGPVPPMQGFFVKITEDTKVWFMGAEFNAKSAPKPVNRGTMPVKMNLHKVVPVEK